MLICGVFTAPYYPSANGTVKHVNHAKAIILCKILIIMFQSGPNIFLSLFLLIISLHTCQQATLFFECYTDVSNVYFSITFVS